MTLKCSENQVVLHQAVLQWVKRREAKLGMMYSKTPVDRREAIPWASLTQMSLLSTSRRISNRLLAPLVALPREPSHGTTWRHITFLMGRELCSTTEEGDFIAPTNRFCSNLFFSDSFQKWKKKINETDGGPTFEGWCFSVRGLVFNLHSLNVQGVQYAGN